MESPRQLGNGFGGKFHRFPFEAEEPVKPTIREQLRGTVQPSVRKLKQDIAMARGVKREGAGLDVGGQLNFWKIPLQIRGYLSQVRHLFRRDHHEFAGSYIGRQRIIRKDDGIHAHGVAKNRSLALQTNPSIHDA
jgi:hypothetical protein